MPIFDNQGLLPHFPVVPNISILLLPNNVLQNNMLGSRFAMVMDY